MNKTNHKLTINNYKSFDRISYQIVLLKGSITNSSCATNEPHMLVENEKVLIGPKNTFKALVRLNEGLNTICFYYCCQADTFSLTYQPFKNNRAICPLYVIFREHDGSFQAPPGHANDPDNAVTKLELNCQLIQTILAEKLYEQNLHHHTFHLVPPKIFYSDLSIEESRTMTSQLLFHKLATEIEKSAFASDNIKHIAFLAGTKYKGELYKEGMLHEDLVKLTERYVALGCGGLAAFHTACLYSWPNRLEDVVKSFLNETKITRELLLDDSNYRGTWGTCYSTTLGSVLHEVCHTFDLGHADVGIMSRGFDDVRDIFLIDSIEAIEADRRKGAHGVTDSTALHKSGAYILRYNKWFLNEEKEVPHTLTFDPEHHVLQSSWGIRVVEVRSGEAQIMTKHWIFGIARMNLQLQLGELKDKSMLFAQDSKGNTLKVALNY